VKTIKFDVEELRLMESVVTAAYNSAEAVAIDKDAEGFNQALDYIIDSLRSMYKD